MKKLTLSLFLSLVFCVLFAVPSFALDFSVQVDGAAAEKLKTNTSNMYKTDLNAGSVITVNADSDIAAFYLVWYKVPGEWTLNDTKTVHDGFLKEFVEPESPAKSFQIKVKDASKLCYIRVFGVGETVPDDVQKWEKPKDRVDVMVFSTHSDDESLFLGGAMADILGHYPDANIQLVYMTNHLALEPFRENERLDALWVYGLKNYPIVGEQADAYAMNSLEAGLKVCDYDKILSDFKGYIATYRPQVIITQDFNGEYGHAQHMVMTKAVCEAVESLAADGIYDVPKTYVHLYKEQGAIELDLRQPLEFYGGKTAVEVAAEAYTKHVSQQKWWFYVSDDYKYSCDEFGLWRTSVPADTGKDMMENIKLYKVQDEEEAERLAKEEAEKAAKEAEKKQNAQTGPIKNRDDDFSKSRIIIIVVIAICSFSLALLLTLLILRAVNKRRLKKRREARRKMREQHSSRQDQ